jgi:pimeloyl-ACP methyl ester carboxylesterase
LEVFVVKFTRLVLVGIAALAFSLPIRAFANGLPPACQQSSLGNQLILLCLPPNWNGTLVVYAHGYVPPQLPLTLPITELTIGGQFLPEALLAQGFAFVTSSFSKNGYAIQQARDDLNALVNYFNHSFAPHPARKVLAVGASEGGLIVTMLVELRPEIYDGGLALCGPVGGMPSQVKYLGDFAVVFNYFFPSVFSFGVANPPVPAITLNDWLNFYAGQAIPSAMLSDQNKTNQLFHVTHAARDPSDPVNSAVASAVSVLSYNVLGTPDLIATTGGMPYGNRFKLYFGSANDLALNFGVERVTSTLAARSYVKNFYQTTGQLRRPLVTLHTTLDPTIPFQHELLYLGRVTLAGHLTNLTVLPVSRYGHCNFTPQEVLGAFTVLTLRTRTP